MSEDNEIIDSPNDTADTEQVVDTADESADDSKPDVEKLQETNKKLFNRAKTAEAELKKLKSQPKVEAPSTNADVLTREEAILIAEGMNADDLDKLKAVAQIEKLSLLKAKDTELFQGYLERIETQRKKDKAKLSASKGSQTKQEKSVADLTDEEHKALVKETFGN